MLSLLGTADPTTLRRWFSDLSEGGRVVDELQARGWGASDGQVIDRFGVHWLIGFEGDEGQLSLPLDPPLGPVGGKRRQTRPPVRSAKMKESAIRKKINTAAGALTSARPAVTA